MSELQRPNKKSLYKPNRDTTTVPAMPTHGQLLRFLCGCASSPQERTGWREQVQGEQLSRAESGQSEHGNVMLTEKSPLSSST